MASYTCPECLAQYGWEEPDVEARLTASQHILVLGLGVRSFCLNRNLTTVAASPSVLCTFSSPLGTKNLFNLYKQVFLCVIDYKKESAMAQPIVHDVTHQTHTIDGRVSSTNSNDINGIKCTLPRRSPKSLAHVVLRTSPEHYETMIQFYCDLLSAEVVHRSAVITFIRYDDEHHRIAIVQLPDVTYKPKNSNLAGLDHVAFSYETLTELAQQYRYLKSLHNPLKPLWVVNHGPTTSMYYRDPDGNKIELQVDNFDKPEEANAIMAGPLYDMNPIGTDFDPDEWSDKILAQARDDGSEGLTKEEVKKWKTRIEIGQRHALPDNF